LTSHCATENVCACFAKFGHNHLKSSFVAGAWRIEMSRITRENFVVSSGEHRCKQAGRLSALITYNANSVAAISAQFCVKTGEGN
jgi:hypothetical protein